MIGSQISHYKITALLGGGAMGQVYKAEDTVLGRPVALKILPPYLAAVSDPVERFLREARAASALDHPNICTVYEIGRTDDGLRFLAMAWCEGVSLQQILARGPLAPQRAARLALQVARGLAHAHRHGVVHRDIKPGNIMVGKQDAVKIVDFGLARLTDQARLTLSGSVLGTPGYMAPEQIQDGKIGPGADIWALGIVLYEMLVGKLPFAAGSNIGLLKAVVEDDPAPLGPVPAPAGPQLQGIITRCLRKDPQQRFPSAAVLADALSVVARDPARADPAGGGDDRTLDPTVAIPPWPRRRLALPIGLAILLIAALALAPGWRRGLTFWSGDRDSGPGSPPVGLAVAPLAVTGPDSTFAFFGQGLAWSLAERLSRLEKGRPEFWVLPPDLIGSFDPDPPAGSDPVYGADRVLTGAGLIDAGHFDLRLALQDGSGDTLASTKFAQPLTNLKTWQRDLATWLLAELDPGSDDSPGEALFSACTTVPAAFVACQTGLGRLAAAGSRGDAGPAVRDFSAAVASDSSFALAWMGLGRALYLQDRQHEPPDFGRAIACLQQAASLDPASAWTQVYLGDVYERAGDDAAALEAYRRALAADPIHARALPRLGALLSGLGQTEEAEDVYLRAVTARPRFLKSLQDAGVFYYYQGRYPEAADRFALALDLAPDHCGNLNLMWAALFESGRYAEAESLLLRSVGLRPTLTAFNNLATLYYFDGRYADAIGMARQALQIDPDNYQRWQLKACCLWAIGEVDSALVAYRKVLPLAEEELRLTPDDPYLLADLASTCAHLGQTDRARGIIAGLTERRELTPEVMFCLADVHETLGDRNSALDWLERAVAADLSLQKVRRYPGLRNLRADPRFAALQAAYGDQDGATEGGSP